MKNESLGLTDFPNKELQKSFSNNDLEKAKYVKREGAPGNYKYTYKEPEEKFSSDEKEALQKISNVLVAIKNGQRPFFNIAQYKKLGLVKEHGVDTMNRTKWVVTEKGERIMNSVLYSGK